MEREEGFNGLIAFAAEKGCPLGLRCCRPLRSRSDKPPLPNGGKLERYTPIVQNSALVFMASPDAAVTEASIEDPNHCAPDGER